MSINDIYSTPDTRFGKRLRALIDAAGISVDRFAKALGVHRDTPQKWFSGASFPQRKYHCNISKILNIPVEQIFSRQAYGPPTEKMDQEFATPAVTYPATANELLDAYRELNQSRKQLEIYKDKIAELEELVRTYEQRFISQKRKGDRENLDPAKLRQPISLRINK